MSHIIQSQSYNKLFEEILTRMIVEFDTVTRFKSLAEQGDVNEGLRLLDKLDKLDVHFKTHQKAQET